MSDTVLFNLEATTATITFNRPRELNAVNLEMARALGGLATKLPALRDAKAIVLKGAGDHFMAGGDIAAFRGEVETRLAVIGEIIDNFHAFILALQKAPQPVICAIRGAAAGGGFSMAIGGDIVIADETARFTPAYRRLGTTPDGGGTLLLPERVGANKAAELFLAGGSYTAAQALELRLVNSVVAAGALDVAIQTIAAELSKNSAGVSSHMKALLKRTHFADFEAHLEAEKASFLAMARRPDFTEGVNAFLSKRAPVFSD